MKTKLVYTKSLGEKVASHAIKNGNTDFHVIRRSNLSWSVVRDGRKKATKVFSDKFSAIDFARQKAQKMNGQVIIHGRLGEVEDRIKVS